MTQLAIRWKQKRQVKGNISHRLRHYCYSLAYDEFGNQNYSAPWQDISPQRKKQIQFAPAARRSKTKNQLYQLSCRILGLKVFAIWSHGINFQANRELTAGELCRCHSWLPLWCYLGTQMHGWLWFRRWAEWNRKEVSVCVKFGWGSWNGLVNKFSLSIWQRKCWRVPKLSDHTSVFNGLNLVCKSELMVL